jgi:quinol monooxygenase YgiN
LLIVAGTIDVDPADREAYLVSKAEQVAHTRTEAGCLDYCFSADASDPGRVRLFERWEDDATFGAHVEGIQANPTPEAVAVRSRQITVYDATAR